MRTPHRIQIDIQKTDTALKRQREILALVHTERLTEAVTWLLGYLERKADRLQDELAESEQSALEAVLRESEHFSLD
jgi:predicted  nucleic acid-binding Zn-ribbon protein